MPPDEPTDEERQEQLPQDHETPFRPASDSQGTVTTGEETVVTPPGPLDDTHPATDTNIDPGELYDEGVAGASEAGEPNSGNAVKGYTPDDEQDPRAETGQAAPS